MFPDFGVQLAGFSVLYASCEVSAEIISDRTDANVSDTLIALVGSGPSAVADAVKKIGASAGPLYIEEFASGSLKPSELRRLIDRYRMRGVVFDLIAVDYADIMAPEHRTDREVDNQRTIYLDLRAIAFENDVAVLTATQTNREGAKAAIAKATDVAEDFNKIRTADIVISINSTDAEKLAGEARLFFAACRNMESGFILRIKQDRGKMQFLKSIIGRESVS